MYRVFGCVLHCEVSTGAIPHLSDASGQISIIAQATVFTGIKEGSKGALHISQKTELGTYCFAPHRLHFITDLKTNLLNLFSSNKKGIKFAWKHVLYRRHFFDYRRLLFT